MKCIVNDDDVRKVQDNLSKERALANAPTPPGPSAVKEVGGLAGDGYMMGEYHDNISQNIWSFGHLVIWSFLRNIHTIFGHNQHKKRNVIMMTGPALGLTI